MISTGMERDCGVVPPPLLLPPDIYPLLLLAGCGDGVVVAEVRRSRTRVVRA
jgi:hypothetical protein